MGWCGLRSLVIELHIICLFEMFQFIVIKIRLLGIIIHLHFKPLNANIAHGNYILLFEITQY